MNWAGPEYNDVGMEAVNKFWQEGFPADLIPSSEIEEKNLYIDIDGWICYGMQRYSAVVLYNPEFEKSSTADFFSQAQKGPTELFRVGDWTKDFNGKTYDGNRALPEKMFKLSDIKLLMLEVTSALQERGIAPQTPATSKLVGFGHVSSSPPTTGFCRLIDGTMIQIAGTDSVAGDPIQSAIKIGEYNVMFNASGVAAVRLDGDGSVETLAAGGLIYFKVGDFEIKLDQPTDIALWRKDNGGWRGVIQGWYGVIPEKLMNITNDWIRLGLPVPLKTD
jgi:hypothetical protein